MPTQGCAIHQGHNRQPSRLFPGQHWRARNPLFCFGKVHCLLQNLVLQSLAAQGAFKLFDAFHSFLQFQRPVPRFCLRQQPPKSLQCRPCAIETVGRPSIRALWRPQCLRRRTLETTSTRSGLAEDIVIFIVVFLAVNLRNTYGTGIQGANSQAPCRGQD